MAKLLEKLGFVSNPFESYVAENEPEINRYFIRPPYYDAVTARGQASKSLILFGARGAGKSATRLTFFRNSWLSWQENRTGPLVVTLDDYTRIQSNGSNKIDLGMFVYEVGFLVVEGLLIWLAALEEDERLTYVGSLTVEEEAVVIPLLRRFYLSRPELVREASVREPLKLLNQAWHKRTRLWAAQKWDSIADLVGVIAQSITNKALTTNLEIKGGLSSLLKADQNQWNDSQYAKAILTRFADFARLFGFDGVTLLIDKVDETEHTNNSAKSTASLIYPILATTQMLEVDGFGWIFFLWDKVFEELNKEGMQVRFDKIANATIQWEEAFLRDLVQKRIQHFSNDTLNGFRNLCDDSIDANETLSDIIQLVMKSPRELIRVLDTMVREHDDQFAADSNSPLLVRQTIDRALNKYAVETVKVMYDRVHLQQIVKLASTTFINKDVQQVFRINVDTARNRIRNWTDAGFVTQTGSRPAEGGTGGKPSYEFSIVDSRIKRIVINQLPMGAEYEFVEGIDIN